MSFHIQHKLFYGAATLLTTSAAWAQQGEATLVFKDSHNRFASAVSTETNAPLTRPAKLVTQEDSAVNPYSQRTSGGRLIRIDSVRPPDCSPNSVPRS